MRIVDISKFPYLVMSVLTVQILRLFEVNESAATCVQNLFPN
jgi:hypothetical protein